MIITRRAHYVAAFLRRKWEPCRTWENVALLRWVQWFMDHGRCLTVSDKGRIQCVALFRCVDQAEDIRSPFANSPSGKIAYIEVAASKTTEAMKATYTVFADLVSPFSSHIAWVRGKYGNRFTIHPLKSASRHLLLAA